MLGGGDVPATKFVGADPDPRVFQPERDECIPNLPCSTPTRLPIPRSSDAVASSTYSRCGPLCAWRKTLPGTMSRQGIVYGIGRGYPPREVETVGALLLDQAASTGVQERR